jgi:SAM-dependent methyltransferase
MNLQSAECTPRPGPALQGLDIALSGTSSFPDDPETSEGQMGQTASIAASDLRYEFGKNWSEFVSSRFHSARLERSRQHLLQLLRLPDLKGRSFLDIGCGSGLHSLAAWQSGAEHVFSFDYDPQSVGATRHLRQLAGAPANWIVEQGDVLDSRFLHPLKGYDIVYSWGVLHHTGSMWNAIRNASQCVTESGLFCIALYTTEAYFNPTPEFWVKVKQRYTAGSQALRQWMEWWYFARFMAWPDLKHLKNPLRHFRGEEEKTRGMSLWTDIRDWLGGWPMEFAGINETRTFCQEELKLRLLWMTAGEACTEYLFTPSKNTCSIEIPAEERPLPRPFHHLSGYAAGVDDSFCRLNQEAMAALGTTWVLFEEDEPLAFPRAPLEVVQREGYGQYGGHGGRLYFSASDGSDPDHNGRTYSLRRAILPEIGSPIRDLRNRSTEAGLGRAGETR